MKIRLVLADDHPLVLEGLANLLGRDGAFEVLAQCPTGREALEAVREHRPDLLVLDLQMPGMDGLEVLRRLQEDGNGTRVVLLTGALDEDEVLEAIRLGVKGVVLKEMAPSLLIQCLRKVHAGGQWLEKESVGKALEKLLRREAGAREAAAALTPREIEVVQMTARGLRNKEIAERLFLSEGTVKVHLHNIYEKLGLDGRVALLLWARERSLD
ncbi:MAG: response regulator [Deferrisomatales bacterium]